MFVITGACGQSLVDVAARVNICAVRCSIAVGLHEPRRANMDHIIPLSKGGHHVPSNIQTLCRACNIAKKNKVGGDQLLLTG